MAFRNEAGDAEILLAEMQHRLANAFHLIAGFVLQQMRAAQHEEARTRLKAVHSVVTLAIALQQSIAAARGQTFGLYLQEIARAWNSLGAERCISVTLETDPSVDIPDNGAAMLALVVHELVSNAVEHAFLDRGEGQVRVGLSAADDGCGSIWVLDDGIGIDAGRWPSPMPSDRALTGLWLVQSLATRLGGTLTITRANPTGTLAVVTFPI